jgi:uncharacterized membrane protein
MNSEQSTDLIDVLGDPFAGALWSGPPYSAGFGVFSPNIAIPDRPPGFPGSATDRSCGS